METISPEPFGLNPQGPDQLSSDSNVQIDIGLLKALSEKRTKDGNPPKRRGPKPDSKPALTRRQELNRQAQRTHRERKEQYIKSLEDQLLKLEEGFVVVTQAKNQLADENRQLKELLAQHGINWAASPSLMASPSTSHVDEAMNTQYSGGSSSRGTYSNTVFTPPRASHSTTASVASSSARNLAVGAYPMAVSQQGAPLATITAESLIAKQQQLANGTDMVQAGVDFVLTLERPCMDHQRWLMERTVDLGGGEPCGHALMASWPSEPLAELTAIKTETANTAINNHLVPVPVPQPQQPHKTQMAAPRSWADLSREESATRLAMLIELSKQLDLDGEVTPVMAWVMVLEHPRVSELTVNDFARLSQMLREKVRCYGFGAVLENYEVRDCLELVFSARWRYIYENTILDVPMEFAVSARAC